MTGKARDLAKLVNSAPSPSKLAHFVLRTSDLKAMRAWYLKVLSGRVAFENEQVCFITYDDEHHRVGILQFPNIQSSTDPFPTPGMEHVSFTYSHLGELLATYRRLKGDGMEPFWPIIHGPTVSMYYRDPDGNKVELQIDVFKTAAEANDFLDKYYPENFMGIIFDPEEMIRKYEAGVPLEELYRRPALPHGMTPWDMHRG